MKLEFCGVRGSMPVSGEGINKYGGFTSCYYLVTSEGKWIIVDAGTGIKNLGESMVRQGGEGPVEIHLLMTHFHLDHVIGLPYFAPLYSPKTTLNIYSTSNPEEAERYLCGLMGGRYFPLEFGETPSKKVYKKIPEKEFHIGAVSISYCPLTHPQESVSYKLQEKEKKIVFATDTEHSEEGIDLRLASFAREADIFVYDAMFTPEEYEAGRQGWGHSTWLEGTKLAKEAGVRKLYLSHFNPDHSDKKIDGFISLAREKFPQTYGAREGLKIVL
jgi:phosphoribosyl 1,2-cyclic phosphodiesterase